MYKIINRTNWRIYEHEHEQNPDCFIDESALNLNNKCKPDSNETFQGSQDGAGQGPLGRSP